MDAAAAPQAADAALDGGLGASVYLYEQLSQHIGAVGAGESVSVSKKQLLRLRRAATRANQCIGQIVKESNQRENRLVVEMHLLREACKRDVVDHEAHRARVFERLRRRADTAQLNVGIAGKAEGKARASGGGGFDQLDRSMQEASMIEASIRKLSPCAPQGVHGAGMLAATSDVEHAERPPCV
jgi:hypothetical protein